MLTRHRPPHPNAFSRLSTGHASSRIASNWPHLFPPILTPLPLLLPSDLPRTITRSSKLSFTKTFNLESKMTANQPSLQTRPIHSNLVKHTRFQNPPPPGQCNREGRRQN